MKFIKLIVKLINSSLKSIVNLFANIWSFLIGERFLQLLTAIFAIFSLLIVAVLALTLPSSELKDILQSFAQLNVTVAIGVGALAIAVKSPDNKTFKLIKEILMIITVSVFSFFLSYIQHELIQRLYVFLSGVVIVFVLVSISKYVIELSETNKKRSGNCE